MSEDPFKKFVGEVEKMDAEATWSEIVLSHEKFDYYMGLLQSPHFLRRVEAGEFKVKEKRHKNSDGDEILDFIEIRNEKGEIIIMENTTALIEMSEHNSLPTEPKSN